MPNELIWLLFLIVNLIITVGMLRYFGKEGLYIIIGVNVILCNIQVLKIVPMFGYDVTLGNILYGSVYFATDLLGEFYGKKEAYKGVIYGFITMILMTIVMQFGLWFSPSQNDFINPSLVSIFSIMPRIVFASFTAYVLSQIHDVWVYGVYKKATGGKHLWLRNNASTIVSQFIDTVVFVSLAFWGVFPMGVFLSILVTTYIMKLIVALLDTPFIYLASKIRK